MENPSDIVRRVDEDRWLASRFAEGDVRAQLIAIYALNNEIARVAEMVREPAVGAIRLAWWREKIADIHAGRPVDAHRYLTDYARGAGALPSGPWTKLTEAHTLDFETAPFANWADVERYVDDTAGAVMQLAIAVCAKSGAEALAAGDLARAAGRAWGYVGLLRAAPAWEARGRTVFPGSADGARKRARGAHAEARKHARRAPAHLFPAYGYVAFVPGYLRKDALSLFERHARLVWASATGRL